jgi:hypothetical protein
LAKPEFQTAAEFDVVEFEFTKNLFTLMNEEKKRIETEIATLNSEFYSKLSDS